VRLNGVYGITLHQDSDCGSTVIDGHAVLDVSPSFQDHITIIVPAILLGPHKNK